MNNHVFEQQKQQIPQYTLQQLIDMNQVFDNKDLELALLQLTQSDQQKLIQQQAALAQQIKLISQQNNQQQVQAQNQQKVEQSKKQQEQSMEEQEMEEESFTMTRDTFVQQHTNYQQAIYAQQTSQAYDTALKIINSIQVRAQEMKYTIQQPFDVYNFMNRDRITVNKQGIYKMIKQLLDGTYDFVQKYSLWSKGDNAQYKAFCLTLNPQEVTNYLLSPQVLYFLEQLSLLNPAAWRQLEHVLTGGTPWDNFDKKFYNCKIKYIQTKNMLHLQNGNPKKNLIKVCVVAIDYSDIVQTLNGYKQQGRPDYAILNDDQKKCYVFVWYDENSKLPFQEQQNKTLSKEQEFVKHTLVSEQTNQEMIKAIFKHAPESCKVQPQSCFLIRMNNPFFSQISQYIGQYSQYDPIYQVLNLIHLQGLGQSKFIYLQDNVSITNTLDPMSSTGLKNDYFKNIKQTGKSFKQFSIEQKIKFFQNIQDKQILQDRETKGYTYLDKTAKTRKCNGNDIVSMTESHWREFKPFYKNLSQQEQILYNIKIDKANTSLYDSGVVTKINSWILPISQKWLFCDIEMLCELNNMTYLQDLRQIEALNQEQLIKINKQYQLQMMQNIQQRNLNLILDMYRTCKYVLGIKKDTIKNNFNL